MNNDLYNNLYAEGLISEESLKKIRLKHAKPVLFSVHWELRTLLYIGVLLLTGGLGLLIYENIDTIGHGFVLMLIALICIGSFYYCFKNKLPFNKGKVQSPNSFFDYILLLASTSFLIFVGYLQFEYKVFGNSYGMATFIPMLVLFFIAYYFDHIGILSMAIANLAIWMGVSVAPKQLLLNSDFNSGIIIYTYLLLGIILIASAFASQYFNFKKHFKFSYQHYGIHLAYIAMLAGYFHYYDSVAAIVWLSGIAAFSLFMYKYAFSNKSFYFLLLVVLYSYVALSCLLVRFFVIIGDAAGLYFTLFYFIGSGTGFIFLLINLNKKLKAA